MFETLLNRSKQFLNLFNKSKSRHAAPSTASKPTDTISASSPNMGSAGPSTELDCLIIGAGFGGCYQLKLLRDAGFKCKVVEAAPAIGGVWAWNRYPGARVDVEMPYYGYSDPKIWETWNWTQRFPTGDELVRYFQHVAQVWDLPKDISLNTKVVSATLGKTGNGKPLWTTTTEFGDVYHSTYLICGTGTSYKQYMPEFEGMETYKGALHHSSQWPEDLDIAGKRVAIIGAGSTGVQVLQEAAKVSTKVTQFIRSPNLAMPMRQRDVSREEIYAYKPTYKHALEACRMTASGLPAISSGLKTFHLTDAERQAFWEERWERGGFNWSIGGFTDYPIDKNANRIAYNFWAEKTRARIKDPKKRDILAPLEPPYYIGTKRPSLEVDYYEMADQDNVTITNSPITCFTETGIVTADGEEEFDIIAVCTGYDAVTGGLMTMNIKGENDVYLHDKWASGVATLLGLMTHGFPNMFMLYGPQAPTSLANGPVFLELECELVRDILARLRDENRTTIDAKKDKEDAWRQNVLSIAETTLAIHTNSWYMGANVPGKRREFLLYMGGIPNWHDACKQAVKDWESFNVK